MKKQILFSFMLCLMVGQAEASVGQALGRLATRGATRTAPRAPRAPVSAPRPSLIPSTPPTEVVTPVAGTPTTVTTTTSTAYAEPIEQMDRTKQIFDIARGGIDPELNKRFWQTVYGGASAIAGKVLGSLSSSSNQGQVIVIEPVLTASQGQLVRVAPPFPVEGGVSAAIPKTGPEGWTRGDIHDIVQGVVGGIVDKTARQAVRDQIYSAVNFGLVMAAKASESGVPAPLYRALTLNPQNLNQAQLEAIIQRYVPAPASMLKTGSPAEITLLEDNAAEIASAMPVTEEDWKGFFQAFVSTKRANSSQNWQQFKEQMLNFENPQTRNRAIAALIVLGALLYWFWGDENLPIENSGLRVEQINQSELAQLDSSGAATLPDPQAVIRPGFGGTRTPAVVELTDFIETNYDRLVKTMLDQSAAQIIYAVDNSQVVNPAWAHGIAGLSTHIASYNDQLDLVSENLADANSLTPIVTTIKDLLAGYLASY